MSGSMWSHRWQAGILPDYCLECCFELAKFGGGVVV